MDPSPTRQPLPIDPLGPTLAELRCVRAELAELRAELAPLVAMFHQLQQARGRLGKALRPE